MSARDEIAALAAQIDHEIDDLYSPGDDVMGEDLAVLLHASGYRKPRTITTVEELREMAHGSVIRSEHRHYWVAHKEDGEGGNQGWAAAGSSHIPDLTTWLPATVLHEPTPGGADLVKDWAGGAQNARVERIEGEKR